MFKQQYEIFNIQSEEQFEKMALQIFRFQAKENPVYHQFLKYLNTDLEQVQRVDQIPFLPIPFFKSHKIISSKEKIQETFLSSATTGAIQSQHFVTDVKLYEESYLRGFQHFYGAVENYTILALLPNYLERKGSSLIYMVNDMIAKSKSPDSGFYLHNLSELSK